MHKSWPALFLLLLTAGLLTGCNGTDEQPSVTTENAAARLQLEIRPVISAEVASEPPSTPPSKAPSRASGKITLPDASGNLGRTGENQLLLLGPVALTGSDVASAEAAEGQYAGAWQVSIDFTDEGSTKFAALTREAACAMGDANRIAIVVDEEVISSPTVDLSCGSELEGGTTVNGNFNEEEAKELAERINDGQ